MHSEHLRCSPKRPHCRRRILYGEMPMVGGGSEGALAGAKIRYMPQLKVEVDVDAPQLDICCLTLHGAALDATWVQLDQTEATRWAEGAIYAVSRWAGVSPIEARAHGCCRRPAGRQRRAYDCTLVAIEGSDLLCIFYHCSRDSRTLVRDEGHTAGAAGIRASPRSRSGSLTFLSAGRAAGRARSARPPGRPSRILLTAGCWLLVEEL
jgi:hypothetical protein